MKILRIHITNIASLTDADIDFEHGPLAMDPIFLITGPTGVGKSTILNSICLALYNNCPPLEDTKRADHDSDNLSLSSPLILIRKGAGRAEIRLEFIANDGRRYVALWSQRKIKTRTKKDGSEPEVKYESTRTLIDVEAGIHSPLTNNLSETLTGLTYEQFTRTTLLAQGEFSRFLKASGAEKAQVLEKITGTDIYSDIGRRIAEEYKEISSRLKLKKDLLEGLQILSDEKLGDLRDSLSALAKEATEADERQKRLLEQIAWLKQRGELSALLRTHREEVAQGEAHEQTEAYREKVALVEQFDATVRARDLIREGAQAQKRLDQCSADCLKYKTDRLPSLFGAFEALEEKIETSLRLRAELEAKVKGEEALAEAFVSADVVCNIAATVSRALSDIADKETEIHALKTNAESLAKSDTAAAEALDQAQDQADRAQKVVDDYNHRKGKIDIRTLTNALNALKDRLRHITDAERAVRDLNDVREATVALEKECEQIKALVEEARAQKARLEAERPSLEKYYNNCNKLYNTLTSIGELISRERSVLAETGTQRCPLCGTDHVTFRSEAAINAQTEENRTERDKAKAELDRCDSEINVAAAAFTTNSSILQSRQEAAEKKRRQWQERQEAFQRDFADVDLHDAAALAITKSTLQADIDRAGVALAEADELIKKADEAQTLFNAATSALSSARTARERASKAMSDNDSNIRVLTSAVETLRNQIAGHVAKANEILPAELATDEKGLTAVAEVFEERANAYFAAKQQLDDLVPLLRSLDDSQKAVEQMLRPFEAEREALGVNKSQLSPALQSEVSTFIAEYRSKKAFEDAAREALETIEEKISAYLQENPQFSRQALILLNEKAQIIADYRQNIKVHTDSLLRARGAVASMENQLAKHDASKPEMPEDATLETLQAGADAEKAKIDTAKSESAKIQAQIDADDKVRADSEAMIVEIKEIETLSERWKRLNELLGTNNPRFRNIAQNYVLRTLLAKANHYLRHFSTRYTLTAHLGSLTISVVDNEWPGSPRAATSLSGGESFVVSLALALALASISKDKINVDTLFIDEGFGSLDSSSLSMIIDALDTLYRIGGRRIGIISHIEALKERIPTQLRLRMLGGNAASLSVVSSEE